MALAALCALLLAMPASAAAQDSPTDAQYQAPFLNLLKSPPKKPPAAGPTVGTTSAPVAPVEPAEPAGSDPERSRFSTAIPSPGELHLTAEHAGEGGLLALLLVALLYLPVMIFNKTTERNHEVIAGWFAGRFGGLMSLPAFSFSLHPLALLLATGVVTGFLFSFVEPGFPTEEGSLLYLAGMVLGFLFVAVVFFATWREVVHRLEPESQGHWRLYPPYIFLAAALVIFARLAHFLPGVVLGTLAEYEPGKRLSTRTAGLRVLVTYSALMAVGIGAWFAWIPVEHAASEEHASSLTLIADSALAIVFVTGLESVVFGLIPLRFLDGNDLFAWSKGLWFALWGFAVLWFAEVILHPALSTYGHHAGQSSAFWFALMFASLMVVAVGTWLFFKIREMRLGPEPTGDESY